MLPYQLEREPVDRIDGAGKRKLALGGIAYLQAVDIIGVGCWCACWSFQISAADIARVHPVAE